MAELDQCLCGIARVDCEYHHCRDWVAPPYIHDFVGVHQGTGEWLYICAIDFEQKRVKIGPMGATPSPWLNETQAQAQYNYRWGAKACPPGMHPWNGQVPVDGHIRVYRDGKLIDEYPAD